MGWDTIMQYLHTTILCTSRWPAVLPVRDDILVLHAKAEPRRSADALVRDWLQSAGAHVPASSESAARALRQLPTEMGARNIVLVVHQSERLNMQALTSMKSAMELWILTDIVATVVLEGDLAALMPTVNQVKEIRQRAEVVDFV
jgi:hypothetical protein